MERDDFVIAGLVEAVADDLDTVSRATGSMAGHLRAIAEALRVAQHPDEASAEDGDPYKKPNGRLTDAGSRAVAAAFLAGATISEVARKFGIHPSAAAYHRQALTKKNNPTD